MYAPALESVATGRNGRRSRGRRRLWQLMAALAAVVALVLVGFGRSVHGQPSAAYETVEVRPGDTVWAIAAQHYPDADVRQKVDEIESVNGLGGPDIRAGQWLRVPTN